MLQTCAIGTSNRSYNAMTWCFWHRPALGTLRLGALGILGPLGTFSLGPLGCLGLGPLGPLGLGPLGTLGIVWKSKLKIRTAR